MWLLSFAGAFIGAFIIALIARNFTGIATIASIVLNALFFILMFAGGYAGMKLGFGLLKIKIHKSPGQIAALILAIVIIICAGAGGQALFLLTRTEYVSGGDVDAVLLLDASGSMDMNGYSDPRTEAATAFVDGLDGSTYLKLISYAACVLDETQLLDMGSSSDKTTAADFIEAIDSTGTTDYNAALEAAVETFKTDSDVRDDTVKAVILLTDGLSDEDSVDIDSSIAQDFEDYGIKLYIIRIAESGTDTGNIESILNIVDSSGGSDQIIDPSSDGDENAQKILEAFESAFEEASYSKTGLGEGYIMILSQDLTFFQVLIIFITFLLCAVFFQIGYYAKTDGVSLIINLVCAAVVCIVILAAGGNFIVRIIFAALLIGTALVSPNIEEKEQGKPPGSGSAPRPDNNTSRPYDTNGEGVLHV